ncbi:ArnT family glycosyltransferase [Oceanicella actignis]|uniref:Dolichyl-phosphate-mannose-protein mannosyltransferase n=1 Tax=Oceanicella actignis TaxID=1189325 RepID=A0A1M7S148_9RHOB|nr:glycosyltransferase family 39 protein [Oceanicella actignis]SES92632.1 Dolichyl-phosphate-mannose-protein mannosyltransferase [Oceanicella actignis]SHN52166.1 Dolichyl-phosphate-mannose-protein mannosyltransferase [Oceanicella actignis]
MSEQGDTPRSGGPAAGSGGRGRAGARSGARAAKGGAKGGEKAPARGAAKAGARGPAKARRKSPPGAPGADDRRWWARAALLLLGVFALRLAINALGIVPVHFDEAQYWVYAEALDLGYYSKPPLTAWLIRLSTELLGLSDFSLRFFSPVAHLAIGALIFAAARRLWDARTGFWAAALYTAAPGVSVSAMLMTTDPPMMAGWALALWALTRAMTAREGAQTGWWAVAGLGLGLGLLAKYTAIAFALSALGYALFARQGPADRRARMGAAAMAATALAVLAPNLWWNATHGFATIAHLSENAELARAGLHPGKLAEFLGAQLGVFGPVAFAALLAGLWRAARARGWRADWRARLAAWMSAPLLAAMCVQALLSQANPNWAAPAYVAGAILAARWLLERGWSRALRAHLVIGAVAAAAVLAAGALYDLAGPSLPRRFDPFKKMRDGAPLCERALTALEEEGADALASNDRRRLSECMYLGGLGLADIAVWDPDGAPSNHFEMTSRLEPGDARVMVLVIQNPEQAARIARRFARAELWEEGAFATHADRSVAYGIWIVQGFRGY